MTLPDDTTTSDSSQSITQATNSQNRDRVKEVEAPKLRGNRAEEYHRWRRYVNWWIEDTRIPSRRRAAHLIMHCILYPDVAETLHAMTDANINCEEGIHNLMETLDEYFLANSESKLFNLWRQMRKLEKTPDITWDQYLKRRKKIFRELEKYGLKLDDKTTWVAMIDGTNLDQNTKLHIESVTRNQSDDKNLHPKQNRAFVVVVFHIANENGVEERMKGLLKRLHVKFGHASISKLARVVEHSSMKKDMTKAELRQMIEKINDECVQSQKIAQTDQRTAL